MRTGSGGDALAFENSREERSGYLPSQGRSNIHFPLSPWVGEARRLAPAQLGLRHQAGAAHRRLHPTAFQSAWRKRGAWYWRRMGVPPLPVARALAGQLKRAARACRSQCTCVIDEKAPAESLTETLLSSNLIWKSLKVLSHALAQARTVQAKKQLFYI